MDDDEQTTHPSGIKMIGAHILHRPSYPNAVMRQRAAGLLKVEDLAKTESCSERALLVFLCGALRSIADRSRPPGPRGAGVPVLLIVGALKAWA
jgi:hypothetical protein